MFKIIFDDKAIDFLNSESKELRKRIFEKIVSTKEDPFLYFVRLTDRKDYKLRVGKYRIIADIDQGEEIIKITLIGHRKNIYD